MRVKLSYEMSSSPANMLLIKKAYVNDQLIGEVQTWIEVQALNKKRGISLRGEEGRC